MWAGRDELHTLPMACCNRTRMIVRLSRCDWKCDTPLGIATPSTRWSRTRRTSQEARNHGSLAMISCRGVRGATTATENSREAILQVTRQLLALMIRQNKIESSDVASAIFTTTTDLDAEFPAWRQGSSAGKTCHYSARTRLACPARCPSVCGS